MKPKILYVQHLERRDVPSQSNALVPVPFFSNFDGPVRTVVADITGDGMPDFFGGTGPGGGSRVIIYDGSNDSIIANFEAFETSFLGGIYLAVGDITGDGIVDLAVTPDRGGGPVVALYDGAKLIEGEQENSQIARFFGIDDPNFFGGARLALGDVNDDGYADLLIAAGYSGGPRVSLYDGRDCASGTAQPQKLIPDFFAFEDTLRNGAHIALGDLTGDGKADVILGGGPGGAPRVRILDSARLLGTFSEPAADSQFANFFAGDPELRSGVRLAVGKDENNPVLYTAPGDGSSSVVSLIPFDTIPTGIHVPTATITLITAADLENHAVAATLYDSLSVRLVSDQVEVQDESNGIYSPDVYPGIPDVRAVVQSAIDRAAAAGGGTVQITRPGVYPITATNHPFAGGRKAALTITGSNITLLLGPGVTLKLANGQQTDAGGPVDMIVWRNQDNVRFTGGGTISGNTAGQPGWTGAISGENGTRYAQIENGCILYHWGTGTGSQNNVIENLTLADHFSNPINFLEGSGLIVRNVRTMDCGEGPQLINVRNVTWENVSYIDNGTLVEAKPEATDTANDTLAFSHDPSWPTGTKITAAVDSGGLVANVNYFYRRVTEVSGTLHATWRDALANTNRIDLTGSVLVPLTGITAVTEGDAQEFSGCTDVRATNVLSQGYIRGSGLDCYASSRVIVSGFIARNVNVAFEHANRGTDIGDGLVLNGFLFEGIRSSTALIPPVGRAQISNGMIIDSPNTIGIFINAGDDAEAGLLAISNVRIDRCAFGIYFAVQSGVRQVRISGTELTRNEFDGIVIIKSGTGTPDIGITDTTSTGNGRYNFAIDGQGQSFSPTGWVINSDFRGILNRQIVPINSGALAGIEFRGNALGSDADIGAMTVGGFEWARMWADNFGDVGPGSKNQVLTIRYSAGRTLRAGTTPGSVMTRDGNDFVFTSPATTLTILFNQATGVWQEVSRSEY